VKPATTTGVGGKLAKLAKTAVALAAAATLLTGVHAPTITGTPTAQAKSTVATSTTATLTTTYHHPFYDVTQGAFVQAQYLKPGDRLQTPTGTTQITDIHLYHANTTTYDLTIGELHTFYVVAGTTPVLVHNCDLSDRASEIHAAEPDPYVRSRVSTVSVVRANTPLGPVNVVAGSGDGLTPAQMSAIGPGEIVADNIPGTHAEQNALLFINKMGWDPIAGGTSRNVCLSICAPLIRGTGGRMMGNVYDGSGVTTTRQRSFEW